MSLIMSRNHAAKVHALDATLAAGTVDLSIDLTRVYHVSITQKGTPAEEFFGYTWDAATRTLTVDSSEVTSTATLSLAIFGW